MIRLVAALLLIWEPLNFAVAALQVLPTIAYRGGLAMFELAARGGVAALSAAGGLALWNAAPSARRLGGLAIAVSVARTIQSLYWSALPSATMPGDEPVIATAAVAAGSIALAVVWFTGSARSFR